MATGLTGSPKQYHTVLRFRKTPFLECPRELRDIIYNYLLIEPDRRSKRHGAFCPQRTNGCEDLERPPFCQYDEQQKLQCQCAKRQCVGLLLANRQIHDEAAPLFWSRNTHCFEAAETFPTDIGTLREESKQHMQHISIVRAEFPFIRANLSPRTRALVWETIIDSCKNLRSLEIEADLLCYNKPDYARLQKELPHLRTLTLARIQGYPLEARSGWDPPPPPENEKLIFVKTMHDIPLGIRKSGIDTHAIRPFNNLVNKTQDKIHTYILNRYRAPWSLYDNVPTHLSPHLNDRSRRQVINFDNGTSTTVTIYGLPQSPGTRRKLAKERAFEEARRKALGMPSWQKEELALQVKQRKLEKKEQELREIREEAQRKKEEKREEQERIRSEQELKQAKNKGNRRVHLQRKMKKADKIKQEERKRVPK